MSSYFDRPIFINRKSKKRSRYNSPSPSPSPSPNSRRRRRRKSKRSPRAKLIKSISKVLRKYSPSRIKNPYIRTVGEISMALSPIILSYVGYLLYKKLYEEDKNVKSVD